MVLDLTSKTKVLKDNPKDRIEVVLGDDKQPDFKPQMKIQRWDNEVNFSMRAKEDPNATAVEEDGRVKYKTPDYEIHMYEKPNAFEFEWHLLKKPVNNVLETTIQSKGLKFDYQPELTPEQIAFGMNRPENVVGSYAVYHATKRNNIVGGMEYRTGKFSHIFTPEAVDADGNKVWCDMKIDEQKGTLTVTVPQDFLDSAKYPVVVDPKFGNEAIGGTDGYAISGLTIAYLNQTPAGAGNLTKFTVYCRDASEGNMQVGLYKNSDSSKVATGSTVAMPASAAWTDVPISTAITVQGYDLCNGFQNDSGYYYWDSISNAGGYDTAADYGDWPANMSWTNWNARMSCYATYEVGGDDYFETPGDSIALTESLSVIFTKAIVDSLNISESLANQSTLGVSDSVTFAESPATVNEFKRSLDDTHSIAESLVNTTILNLPDAQSIGESLATENEFYRSLDDSISLADAEIEEIVKILADTISITESLVKAFGVELAESVAIVEGLANAETLRLSDGLIFAESSTPVQEVKRSLSDSIAISELMSTTGPIERTPTDSISLTESLVKTSIVNLSDTISLTEDLTSVYKIIRTGDTAFIRSDIY